MATVPFGHIREFDSSKEEWLQYEERLGHFFVANGITNMYALRDKVESELDRLVAEGTLEPVETAEWAAPIVPVLKSDKQSVRICGDFRLTVNPVSKLDNYPIPKVEDLFI